MDRPVYIATDCHDACLNKGYLDISIFTSISMWLFHLILNWKQMTLELHILFISSVELGIRAITSFKVISSLV